MTALATPRELEEIERRAWRDLFEAAPPEARSALGIAWRDVGGALALRAPALETLVFNRVLGLGLDRPGGDAALDGVRAFYRETASPFAIHVPAFAEPSGLGGILAAQGMPAPFHHVKWVRDFAPVAVRASALRVERVPAARALAFGTLAAEAYAGGAEAARDWLAAGVGRPGWTHYVALDGDAPAGCGALFVHGGGAWLGLGATPEAHRRKGAHALLLAARLRDAAAAGCRWVSADSGPDWPDVDTGAWRALSRAGFTIAYERPCHVSL